MTEQELQAIEARANAATPGPWYYAYEGSSDWSVFQDGTDTRPVASLHRWHKAECPEAVFIAHARQDIPALVAEVRRLRALAGPGNADAAMADGASRIA